MEIDSIYKKLYACMHLYLLSNFNDGSYNDRYSGNKRQNKMHQSIGRLLSLPYVDNNNWYVWKPRESFVEIEKRFHSLTKCICTFVFDSSTIGQIIKNSMQICRILNGFALQKIATLLPFVNVLDSINSEKLTKLLNEFEVKVKTNCRKRMNG